jgi:hypothetical protein
LAQLYADHNLSFYVVTGLRRRGHEVVTARDLGLDHATDDEHFLAATRGWILLSHNEKDFILLHDAWHRWSATWGIAAHHAGVIIPPQEWPRERIVREVATLLRTERSFDNELLLWKSSRGWIHRDHRYEWREWR